ncbi:DUF1963 domain-containing protein [Ornithinimicrobium cerasi]|uniref:DUF1963 domain-containing protein n=1 Tax=Ornithinimicrobium cerasi TaxID=2248773 RepID=UPI000EFE02A0|nr:DUF1963 domain-containing protein [Ornithinimicrobium cerasi]
MVNEVESLWDELCDLWALQRGQEDAMPWRAWNRLVERAHGLEQRLLAAPEGPALLWRKVRAGDLDPYTQEKVGWIFALDAEEMLAAPGSTHGHPLVDLGPDDVIIEPCGALVERETYPQDWPEGVDPRPVSRIGGQPTRTNLPPPKGLDGQPLAFIVQVDLGHEVLNHGESRWFAELDLPETGILQLFYDLEHDVRVDPGQPSGALVRWMTEKDLSRPDWLLDHPDVQEIADGEDLLPAVTDTRHPASFDPVSVSLSFMPSLGPPPDHLDEDQYERFEYLVRLLAAHARHRPADWELSRVPVYRAADPTFPAALPSSSVRGLGHYDLRVEVDETREALQKFLPLSDGDRHVLLFDIVSVGNLDGAFGDDGHLEIWIRLSDLRARNFDKVAPILGSA